MKSKEELVGENMEQQLTFMVTLLRLLIKKNIFSAEEFNQEVLRSTSELDQEMARLAAGEE